MAAVTICSDFRAQENKICHCFHLFPFYLPWGGGSNILATWCKELTHWKILWCWERLKAGGEGDDREWDGWVASLTWWTWVWASYRSWWWTGKPGVLQSMGSQKVGHHWVTELTDGSKCRDLSFLYAEFEARCFTLLFHPHQDALEFLFTCCR